VPENCDQGIFFNGSVKKRIVGVFIERIRSFTGSRVPTMTKRAEKLAIRESGSTAVKTNETIAVFIQTSHVATEKMPRPWSQQARQLTPQKITVAHLGNQGCCVHIHTGRWPVPLVGSRLESRSAALRGFSATTTTTIKRRCAVSRSVFV